MTAALESVNPARPTVTLGTIKGVVLRHHRIAALILVASFLVTIVFTAFQTPTYQARASVLIEDRPRVIAGTVMASDWMSEDMLAKAQKQLAESVPVLRLAASKAGPEESKKDLEETLGYLHGGSALVQGRLLYLSAHHPVPLRAAVLANRWAEAFEEQMTERQTRSSKYASSFLSEDVLMKLRDEWYKKQDLLSQFQIESQFDYKEMEKHPIRERHENLSGKLAEARLRLSTLKSEAAAWEDAQTDPKRLSQLPRARQDKNLLTFEKLIQEQRLKLFQLRQRFLPNSEELMSAEKSLRDFEALSKDLLGTLAEQIRADLRAAEDEVRDVAAFFQETEKLFEALKGKASQYQRLSAETNIARHQYEELAKRQREAEVESRVGISYARLWEEAGVPGAPHRPNWPRNLAMGLMLGLLLAAGSVYLAETLDDTVRSLRQLRETMGLQVMGAIPMAERITEQQSPYFLARDFSHALPIESLRTLRSSLEVNYMRNGATPHPGVLLVMTSPGESEGKSFLASNLASLFALGEKRVLLVDMDLHKGTLTRAMGMLDLPGLSALNDGARPLMDLIQPTRIPGLSFLPRGKPIKRPASVVESSQFAGFLDEARRRFDVVLIDTPPVLAVADACHVVSKGDVTLVAVRSRVTRKAQVEEVSQILHHAQAKECTYILNGLSPEDAEASGQPYKYYQAHPYGAELQAQQEAPASNPTLESAP